jgi:hypothetical protein
MAWTAERAPRVHTASDLAQFLERDSELLRRREAFYIREQKARQKEEDEAAAAVSHRKSYHRPPASSRREIDRPPGTPDPPSPANCYERGVSMIAKRLSEIEEEQQRQYKEEEELRGVPGEKVSPGWPNFVTRVHKEKKTPEPRKVVYSKDEFQDFLDRDAATMAAQHPHPPPTDPIPRYVHGYSRCLLENAQERGQAPVTPQIDRCPGTSQVSPNDGTREMGDSPATPRVQTHKKKRTVELPPSLPLVFVELHCARQDVLTHARMLEAEALEQVANHYQSVNDPRRDILAQAAAERRQRREQVEQPKADAAQPDSKEHFEAMGKAERLKRKKNAEKWRASRLKLPFRLHERRKSPEAP